MIIDVHLCLFVCCYCFVLHLLEFRIFNFLIFFHILFALFLTPHIVILCVVPFALFMLCCSFNVSLHFAPLALFFLHCLFLRCCSSRTILLTLPLLTLLFFTSCYSSHIASSCTVVFYKLLLLSHYCSSGVVVPLSLSFVLCCSSHATPPLMQFFVRCSSCVALPAL